MKLAQKLAQKLAMYGQEHLLSFDGLNETECDAYLSQLEAIDFGLLESLHRPLPRRGQISPAPLLTVDEIAQRREEYEKAGVAALRAGKVACVLLAGGQGTRLGTKDPKGAFDIGVTKPVYIFELLIRNLLGVCERCGAYVPLLIMTSEKNDAATKQFLEAHTYFGYPAAYVRFFTQELLPCVDLDGKIMLETRGRLVLSPGGNGGWYASLMKSGVAQEFPNAEWYNVFGVDNVLQRIADPVFIGATILSGAQSGSKIVAKTDPEEHVGMLCLEDGKPAVIEYFELTSEMAHARDGDGNLRYRCGIVLNYLFSKRMLENIATQRIPVHVVKKRIACMGADGKTRMPETENGYKFETLILDFVNLAGSCLPFEVEREKEFAPVKNRTGKDSVATARALLRANGMEL